MLSGEAVTLWFLASGIACILLLAWAAISGLGAGRYRGLALILFLLTGALAVLPTSLRGLSHDTGFPYGLMLFSAATICLLAAVLVLWKLRHGEGMRTSADLAIGACLNLWLSLWVVLSPLAYF